MAKEIVIAAVIKKTNHRKTTAIKWHQALGHLNFDNITRLPTIIEKIEIIGNTKRQFCEPYTYEKQKKTPSHKSITKIENTFDSIHIDLFNSGLTLPRFKGGHYYYSTKINQKT